METERILLRPWQDSDAETLFKLAGDWACVGLLPWSPALFRDGLLIFCWE